MTYCQSIQIIQDFVLPLGRTVRLPITAARGLALAEPITAKESNPRFDNSGVDGYAIASWLDGQSGARLRVQGVIAAGDATETTIEPGAAVRIFTGAPTPTNTFGGLMHEDVDREDDSIVIRSSVTQGDFIRRKGSEFLAGAALASIGSVVDSGLSAMLAFVGMVEPQVFGVPKVAIVTTGDEIVDPSVEPKGGQIRDTNSVMLSMQVLDAIKESPSCIRVVDEREELRQALAKASSQFDLVIVSGGASVGDRDYVSGVVADLGIVTFHGVGIRPGKPILFGKIGRCLVFGLPGNPASAFVCFEIFVREALRRLAGWSEPELLWTEHAVDFGHIACGREDFVRVRLENSKLVESGNQGSFGIGSLGRAHGLARFPATENVTAGSRCPVLWLR